MQDGLAFPNDQESPLERRLATILVADVAGYSRMMGENEERTVQTLRGHREIFDALLAMHRGRIFNTAGDAVLAEFPSAVEAVRCATEVQAALRTRNEHLPPDQRMSFRIGINLGDVIVQVGDLLGDGVNVAARIQTVAQPGGICISGSVFDQIQNKLTLQFKRLGEQSFKNIAQPIRTFSISDAGAGALPAAAAPRRFGRKGLIAAGATVAALVALGGGYAAYRGYEARVVDETRRAADAQRATEAQHAAEAQRAAETQRNAEQERKVQQERIAADAAGREARLQAELKATRDALGQVAASRKADEERKAAEAKRRADDVAVASARQEQVRTPAAMAQTAAAPQLAAAPPAVAPAVPNRPASVPGAGVDRFDGVYNGRLCNVVADKAAEPVCWRAALNVERGAAISTWMNIRIGKPAYARGKISAQGAIELTLEGYNQKGDPIAGVMTGTWSDNEIRGSGTWQNGNRVSAQWVRAP